MEPIIIPYLFFGLLAFAAIISVINSFNDDDRHTNVNTADENEITRYPPPVYYHYPPPVHYREPYHHRKPVWTPLVMFLFFIAGMVYLFSEKNGRIAGTHETVVDPVRNEVVTAPHKIDAVMKPVNVNTSPALAIPVKAITPADKAPYFVEISTFNQENAAKVAMEMVASTIDLKGREVKYARTNKGRWMVYIPVNSPVEGAYYESEMEKFKDILQPYCPGQTATKSYIEG